MAKYDAAQWFSNFFLSRRTLKEFLIPPRTGVNLNFLKQNVVFEVWRIVTSRFLPQRLLR